MANHGVTFCGTSIEHATCVGVFLEKACKAHLLGKAAGLRPNALGREVRAKRHAQIMTPAHVEHSWDYFCRMLDGPLARETK
jgi:ribulose-5-phosphate 4-epimerase/fuculose-1-phosphate aldolase